VNGDIGVEKTVNGKPRARWGKEIEMEKERTN
jgi:hypothetical protein